MPVLLVVDDEPGIQHAFQRAFHAGDTVTHSVSTAAEGIAALTANRPDVVVLDIHLPDATGLDTFHLIRAIDARIPVILITGHGTTELAIQAIKEGAYEYLLKPLELRELRAVIDRAVQSSMLMRVPASLAESDPQPDGGDVLLGQCPAIQDVYKAIGRVARQDVTVLILGESGTGKELVARAIYQHSRRATMPFLAINCAAIPETLLESELFGHEKGAFTGSDRRRVGKFEQCHGGTIFLDEVGEMSPLTQAKILRIIQEQRFERVGGNETVQTDVRLIAATNANLEKMTDEGSFRKDLYFRLNGFTIHLPPLRERGDDIQLLVEHYFNQFGRELSKHIQGINPGVTALLRAYPWPGNVRELQSVLKQAILRMSGPILLQDFLPPHLTRCAIPADKSDPIAEQAPASSAFDWDEFVNDRIIANTENLYAESLDRMEREILLRVLRHTEGNQLQAARILGITRGSLRFKIRTLGISIARVISSDDDQGDA
jgi:two-component system, NtrC family, response regulator AtoC